MDTDQNDGENKMADEQEAQIPAEVSADKSPSQVEVEVENVAENGDALAEPVVAEEVKSPVNNVQSEQPGLEVPVLETSAETADGNILDNSSSLIVIDDEEAEKNEDDVEMKQDEVTETLDEAAEKTDEVTEKAADATETPNEESSEVVQSEEAVKEEDLGNEMVAIHVEMNIEEPEEEQGALLETSVEEEQPLTRGGTPVLNESTAIVQVPDVLMTPPPVLVEGEQIDDTVLQVVNRSLNDDNASIASSLEVPVYNRAELIERYQQAVEERSSLQSLNSQLQHKLAEYFRKKKTDERQQEVEKNASDQEQRYIKYLANLDELQAEQTNEQESYIEQIEELKDRCFEKQNRVKEAREEFMKHKYDVAKQALNSRSGRPIPVKDIDQYQIQEQKKDHEVMLVRLENIKLKNRLKKREMQLKAKEELAEGLHLIDFEQLKIENQTYNEKIEERNEELLKLRKKITTTVQVLTHLKEKLQFVQAENAEQRGNLKVVDARVAQKRDVLTRTKQARDALRFDNVKLRQKCGLLGNEPLLRDYEDRKDESSILSEKVECLKMKHAELTMNSTGVKKKIEHTKQQQT